jgi:SAM-dependent methyltransferase
VSATNAEQIEFWNGEAGQRWSAGRERLDRSLAAITEGLFAFAAPLPREIVVDIGCGCGTTTLEVARRTSAPVLGLDISGPMLEVARARAIEGVTFEQGDAASYPFASRYDLVFSRFGVMFFADPVAAFRNLKSALAETGRLALACWRPLKNNPWFATPLAVAAPLLPLEPPVDPHAPGPFAFADPDRVRGILEAAGWREIETRPLDTSMYVGDSVDEAAREAMTIGPLARRVASLPEEVRAAIADRLREAFAPFATSAGVAFPAAVWLIGAR